MRNASHSRQPRQLNHRGRRPPDEASPEDDAGFTMVELCVVIAMLALLALLVLPTRAAGRQESWRAQCANNLKQMGTAFRLFQQDRDEMFPPAVHTTSLGGISWDSNIHRYLGGIASDTEMIVGAVDSGKTPTALRCPADVQPKVSWVSGAGLRSYAMVGAGPAWATQWQVSTQNRSYPLPPISLGVGIYWSETSGLPDWLAKSYRSTVVSEPAQTILLVELPNGQNVAGSQWPCISVGPVAGDAPRAFYQIDPTAPPQDPSWTMGVNQGADTYRIHGTCYNYLFHNGRVEALSIEATVGTGTPNSPKGMWTVAPGD